MTKRDKIMALDFTLHQKKSIQTIFDFIKQPVEMFSSNAFLSENQDDFFAFFLNPADIYSEQFSVVQNIIEKKPYLSIIFLEEAPSIYNKLSISREKNFIQIIKEPLFYSELQSVIHNSKMYYDSFFPLARQKSLKNKLIGSSLEINQVRTLIEQVSIVDANVLILGESGTGKEITAQSIHDSSNRATKPFIPINCGAIPAELLESELFGHEKGAFTGAITTRKGRFELADGGTLFLDEIGDMPLTMQVKLLRVLQERKFERIGSNISIDVDVRIIAATHRDLDKKIIEGEFREDLFYRLNVFPIDIPPLRKRIEDIPLLINELIQRLEKQDRKTVKFMSEAIHALCQYSWPGNIRELANMVERLSILYPNGVVDLSVLPNKYKQDNHINGSRKSPLLISDTSKNMSTILNVSAEGIDLKEHLVKTEVSLIMQALDESHWVVARAADFLTMRRTTLVEKIKKYGLKKVEKV